MSCEWSEQGPVMSEPGMDEKAMLFQLVGLPSWLIVHAEPEVRLIREAYRHGWEAAVAAHDTFVLERA